MLEHCYYLMFQLSLLNTEMYLSGYTQDGVLYGHVEDIFSMVYRMMGIVPCWFLVKLFLLYVKYNHIYEIIIFYRFLINSLNIHFRVWINILTIRLYVGWCFIWSCGRYLSMVFRMMGIVPCRFLVKLFFQSVKYNKIFQFHF